MKLLLPVCLFVLTPFLTACDSKPPEKAEIIRPIPAMKIGESQKVSGRKFPGKAKATQEANLAFDVSGKLVERPVDIGSVVKKGDVIARLNPTDFNAKVKSNKAELKKAKQNFERGKELIKKDFISEREYDRLEAAVDVAEANLAIAQKALSDSVIKAPFGGRISNTYVENFQAVLAKKPIVRLLDTSQIEMVVQVPENLISKVSFIEDIKVTYDTFPDETLSATIKEISNEASSTTRTYPVTLIMPQHDDIEVLPGMAGTATGTLVMPGSTEDLEQLVVPIQAVFTPDTEKQDHVWVIDEKSGSVQLRAVQTGQLTQSGIQIVDGLQKGEWVAIAGIHTLREEQKVRIDSSIVTE